MSIVFPNILLLSIRSQYASMIFEGNKKVELRRVKPRQLHSEDLIIVYATSPKKAIIGVLEVEKIIEDSPKNLWNIVQEKAGIDHDKFREYYKNSSTGFAIFLKNYASFDEPITLEKLRQKWSGFRPPQCYHYLGKQEVNMINSISNQNIFDIFDKPKNNQLYL